MKKYCALIFLTLAGLISCDTDDFCTENPVTPKLILRFYDKDDSDKLKQVERFSVTADGRNDSLFINSSVDSIALPLNSEAQRTVFYFKKNEVDGTKSSNQGATLTVDYVPETEYVSRSCGFRVIYTNLTLQKTMWIDRISVDNLASITNQSNAHINIFH